MTREHKLALIIGFSVLLLVGVLISDHLSRARQVRVDNVDQNEAAIAEIAAPPAAPELVRELSTAAPSADILPASDAGPSIPGGIGSDLSRAVEIAQSSMRSPDPVIGGGLPEDARLRDEILRQGGSIVGGDITLPVRDTTRTAATPAEPERFHSVQKGESLYGIAAKYYGNGNLWKPLAEHNKSRIGDNHLIREGVRLVIPAKETLTGKPAPSAPATAKPSDTRIASNQQKTYTVRDGDTLGEISMKVLGTSKRWQEIVKLNRDVLSDEDLITTGMVLRLPGS